MKIGTKSLLFGIHQVFWHPIVVTRAWIHLYGRPSWKEFVCIFIHDWGYWGKPDLDGKEGQLHPLRGAYLAYKWFGFGYWKLCAGHSRSYVKLMEMNDVTLPISKLCWADKLSFCFEPKWFYLFRATLSGEWNEIYDLSIRSGVVPGPCTKSFWYDAMHIHTKKVVEEGINSHK